MRKIKFIKLILFCFCASIFCIGCGNKNLEGNSTEEKTDNDIQIENNCNNLTEGNAMAIAKDIKQIIIDTQKHAYKINDFSFIFENEKDEGETLLIDITENSKWIRVRNIEDDPIIIGMKKAKEKLRTEEAKEKADGIIQDFIVEMKNENGIEEEKTPEYLKVRFNKKTEKYELFILENLDDESKLSPMKEYYDEHYKENTEERIKLGEETLLQYMQ